MGDLRELAALIRVEVDVVDIERRGDEAICRNAVTDDVRVGALGRVVVAEIGELVELEVDADLVVLERDERERKARVAVEPELERDIERVLRCAREVLRGRGGLERATVGITALAGRDEKVHELGHVTNHLCVAGLLASLLRELIPDLEPVTVVLVDALATDLELNILDKVVADPVEPAEGCTRTVSGLELYLRERRLEVDAVDQVTVALDRAGDLAAEAG